MQKLVIKISTVGLPPLEITDNMNLHGKVIIIVHKESKCAYFVMQDSEKRFAPFGGYAAPLTLLWHSSLEILMKKYDLNHDFYIFDSFDEAMSTISECWKGHFDK